VRHERDESGNGGVADVALGHLMQVFDHGARYDDRRRRNSSPPDAPRRDDAVHVTGAELPVDTARAGVSETTPRGDAPAPRRP
jgi:hypothetical protein